MFFAHIINVSSREGKKKVERQCFVGISLCVRDIFPFLWAYWSD